LIHESKKRFNLAIFGRQSGKTTSGIHKLFYRPLQEKENAIYWYILQTHDAAEIAFKRYVKLFPREAQIFLFTKKPNESSKTVFLRGGREVVFKSGQNFEDLRAETLNGVIIDEFRQQNPLLWTSIIRPMLARFNAWADIYSTPNGFDHTYDLYNDALIDPDFGVFHAPSTEAWWWTREEILSAKRTMSPEMFAQEIMAEFRDMSSGKVYVSHGSWNMREDNPFYKEGPIHPSLPVLVAMDFNLSPMAWTLGQKRSEHFHFFDEIWLKKSHTPEAAEVLAQKILELNPKYGIILAGDASSKSGQRAAAGQSDYDIICQTLDRYNIKWDNQTPDSNPGIKDRINTMNSKLRAATGETFITYNPVKCPHLKKDFDRVVWKTGTDRLFEDQTKDPDLTHSSSGVGYLVCALSPLVYQQTVPALKVHTRSF